MLKRTMAVALAFALMLSAGSVLAQDCSIGVYATPTGQGGAHEPELFKTFQVYVVAFTEDVLNAASYSISFPDRFHGVNNPTGTLFVNAATYGPNGFGISVESPAPGSGNESVGFGECAIGFGGLPVLVACYDVVVTGGSGGDVCLAANPFQDPVTDPTKPQVNNCADILKPCDIGPCLTLLEPVATESVSFGAVKSLY